MVSDWLKLLIIGYSTVFHNIYTCDFLVPGASCPWQIQAQPGQRINLTLYDFAAKQQPSKGDGFGCARKYAQVN